MLKRYSAFLLAFLLMFSIATAAGAAPAAVKVIVGEKEILFGEKGPFIENGTAYVSARTLLAELGYAITWDKESRTVYAAKQRSELSFTIGEANASINGQEVAMSAPAKILDSTAYVPLRFIGGAAGYQVRWDGKSRTAKLEQSRGFFWKVAKDETEVYLLGSIHVGNEFLYPMRPEIDAAFEEADRLVVEVNVAKPVTEEMANRIKSYMQYGDGSKLSDHLDADTYGKLQAILKGIGAPENAFDPYKPWQIVNELTIVKAALSGYQPGLGIDVYYLQKAIEAELPIEELESYEQQFAMFDSFSEELQIQMLQEAVTNFSVADESIAMLAELWVSGNDDQLNELLAGISEQEEYYKAVIENRNVDMTEQIVEYLGREEDGTSFVIAGYLHMLGEHGIVKLLEEQGYKVTRL